MKTSARGVAAAALLTAATAHAPAAPARPCQDSEHRQFDFWIGRWEVFGADGKKAGDNLIEAIDGGCALLERWRGNGGFSGTSLNAWDASARLWRQHWVDNQGGLLRLTGRLEGQRMVLEASEPHPDNKPGATRRQRIAWTPLADGAVRQHWETSDDDGATWTTAFDGRYVKAK